LDTPTCSWDDVDVIWEYDNKPIGAKLENLLFEKPVVKYTRWINIYPNSKDSNVTNFHVTKAHADDVATNERIDCVCVEWTE